MIFRPLLLLFLLAIVGCGGGGAAPGTTGQPPDPATADQWSEWALEAQVIVTFTAQMYDSGLMTRELLGRQIERAQALADEIRDAGPSEQVVLNQIDSLDGLAGALEFVLEFAENQGSPNVGGIRFRSLEDAVEQLVSDANALSRAAGQAEG